MLREYGVTSALLDLGGNVQALGSRTDGSAWRVGIVMPEDQTNFCVLEVRDAAVVTSGNYERFFTADDGAVYGHILDPKTGAPVENGLKSVTIVGAEGKKCDALSTALFVMGADAAIEHWRTYGDFEMVLLTEENVVYITEGVTGRLFAGAGLRGPCRDGGFAMRRAFARLWGLLAGLLFALALAACLLLWNAPGGEWVAVERDGKELFRFRPATSRARRRSTSPCDGGYNTIAVGKRRSARRGGGLPRPDLREDGRAALPRFAPSSACRTI